MKKRAAGILLLGAITLSASAFAATSGMKEGLWEITTTTEMPGMPFTPPPMTITHCFTKEDVKTDQVVPKQAGDCTITDMKKSGRTTRWTVTCTGEAAGTGEGEITFKGDSAYEGSQKFSTQGMNITSRYKAKRIGGCE